MGIICLRDDRFPDLRYRWSGSAFERVCNGSLGCVISDG